MDKLSKRMMYNPDGSAVLKRWDDSVLVRGKTSSAIEAKHPMAMNRYEKSLMPATLSEDLSEFDGQYMEDSSFSWETEIDYY